MRADTLTNAERATQGAAPGSAVAAVLKNHLSAELAPIIDRLEALELFLGMAGNGEKVKDAFASTITEILNEQFAAFERRATAKIEARLAYLDKEVGELKTNARSVRDWAESAHLTRAAYRFE